MAADEVEERNADAAARRASVGFFSEEAVRERLLNYEKLIREARLEPSMIEELGRRAKRLRLILTERTRAQ